MLVELSVMERCYRAIMEVVCVVSRVIEVGEALWGVPARRRTRGCAAIEMSVFLLEVRRLLSEPLHRLESLE
jgi:hypothetical protein